MCFVQVVNLKSKQIQVHVRNLYKTRKLNVTLSNFGLIEETVDLSCILLAVPNIFIHENKNCTYLQKSMLLF